MGEVNAVGGVLTSLDEEVSVDDGMDCLRRSTAFFLLFLASSIALEYVLVACIFFFWQHPILYITFWYISQNQ